MSRKKDCTEEKEERRRRVRHWKTEAKCRTPPKRMQGERPLRHVHGTRRKAP